MATVAIRAARENRESCDNRENRESCESCEIRKTFTTNQIVVHHPVHVFINIACHDACSLHPWCAPPSSPPSHTHTPFSCTCASPTTPGSRHSRYSNGSHGSGGVGRAKPTEPSWISEHPDVFPHGTPADTYNSRLGDTGYSYSDSYYSQSGNSGQLGTTMSMHEVDAYRSVRLHAR